ncbi:LysR family transcriptional regulator [Cupriavidus basilensis]
MRAACRAPPRSLGSRSRAISRQITLLEKTFGGALFYRTGRGVRPTALAEQVLADAAPRCSPGRGNWWNPRGRKRATSAAW